MRSSWVRKVLNNDYAFTVLTKVAALLIGVVSSSLSKQFLGPALEGELGYIDSILTIVAVVASFGLYQPYPYHKQKDGPGVLDKFLNVFSLQYVVYAVLGLGIAWAVGSPAIWAVCLIAPLQVLANQLSFALMVEDVKYKNLVFFMARIINTTVILAAFLTMQPTLLVALGMIVIGDVITIVMSVRRLGRFGNPFKADLRFLKEISGFGLVAMLTTLLLTLNYRVDEVMLKWMGVAAEQRGFYRAGVSLAGQGWLISDAFREVLFSRTAKKDAVGDVTFSLKINLYITLVILTGIFFFGKLAIRILFGVQYLPSYNVTVILLLGVLSMSYFKLIGTLLLAQGRKTVYLVMLSGSALVNILANFVAIPRWGIVGAAWGSVISYTVAGGLFLMYFLRTYQVPVREVFVLNGRESLALRTQLGKLFRKGR